jgi:hypothetical protein
MMAARSPPVSEPRNRKFFLARAIPLSCRSDRLLSIESLPSLRYRASASHRLAGYEVEFLPASVAVWQGYAAGLGATAASSPRPSRPPSGRAPWPAVAPCRPGGRPRCRPPSPLRPRPASPAGSAFPAVSWPMRCGCRDRDQPNARPLRGRLLKGDRRLQQPQPARLRGAQFRARPVWRQSGDPLGDLADAVLASSIRFIELDATAWTTNTVRVMARNISPGATFDLTATTLSVQVVKRRVP